MTMVVMTVLIDGPADISNHDMPDDGAVQDG